MKNIVVFASGGGSNFQTLIDKEKEGLLCGKIVLMVGNNSKAKCFERAQSANIPAIHLAPSAFESETEYVSRLKDILTEYKTDLIVLAGYMKKIPGEIVNLYKNRIINIHPALLPAFGGKGMYGNYVHKAVIEYGAKVSGITVHFIDEEYDHGPVIYQKCVAVDDSDTPESLAEKVLKIEHDSLWRVVKAFCNDKIFVKGRKVFGIIE